MDGEQTALLGTVTIWRRWWPFALLCMSGLIPAVFSDAMPALHVTLASCAIASGLVCVCCSAFLGWRRQAAPSVEQILQAALSGVCLLCGPFVDSFLRPRGISGSDLLIAGSITPVVVAIVVSARKSSGVLPASALWPGIIAAGGLLLLLQQPRLNTLTGVLALMLCPLLTGVGAVLLVTGEADVAPRVASASAGAALAFAAGALWRHSSDGTYSWQAAALEVVIFASSFLSIFRLGAIKYAAFFVVVPLAALLWGFVLLRPVLELRMIVGLLALGWSAVTLLRYRDASDEDQILNLKL